MNKFLGTAVITAALSFGAAAQAATYSFTEGNRTDIDGSERVVVNGTGVGDTAAFTISETLDTGDTFNLHGRIIEIDDSYTFTATEAFSLSWIFDGYEIGGVTVAENESGFVGTPFPGIGDNTSVFTLTNLGTLASVSETFTTDIITGADEYLFTGNFEAGTYAFTINGAGPLDALYDIQISAVPLPAGALLMLTGLAGFGAMRRRKAQA